MSQATAMNMNEPKEDDIQNQKKVKESGAMTILLGKANQVYYYYGELHADTDRLLIRKTEEANGIK